MKRGQTSVEFITIFGFVFLMIIPLILIFFDQSGTVQDSIAENHVRNVAIKIVDKAETMYYLGEPSKATLKAYFPERIENISISQRTVLFNFRTLKGSIHQVVSVSQVNITGNLSNKAGIHYIEIEASGNEVVVRDI